MMDFQTRLNRVIPGGAHTYSRGFDQFPSNAPQIHCAQRSLFGHILAQQAVEVLIAAPLPAAVGVGKVSM